jgi:dTDP-4-dehydrorhamnose reductase
MDWDRNPRISYQQNVVNVLRLVTFCREWNIVVVFLSSDGVFDGHKGNYIEHDRPNPVHRYGVYKAAIETSVRTTSDRHLIFRFGKVLDDDLGSETLLVEMIDSLRQNKQISLAYDQILTPIHINDLVEGITKVMCKNFTGTFHLASLPAISRYDLGIEVAQYLGVSHKLVKPIKLETLELLEKRALRTDLNIDKFCSVQTFEHKTVATLLERLDLSKC